MFKKSIMSFIIGLCLLIPLQLSFADTDAVIFENINYSKSSYIRVFLDGREIQFDVRPQSVNSRVMVPMRAIFQEFGLRVNWNQSEQTVTATGENVSIVFKIGSNTALVNYAEQKLDAPARAINGTTMIPLRFLSENMGYNLVWNSESNIILLSQSNIVEWRYGGYEKIAPYKEFELKYYNGSQTEEMRYTGQNHDVKFYNIYTENGKLSQNVPEYNLSSYGQGWLRTSPFAKKTYWVDSRLLVKNQDISILNNFNSGAAIGVRDLLGASATGNFIKITIEDQYFDINAWRSLTNDSSKYSNIATNEELDGKIILSEDVVFKVVVNDREQAVMLAQPLLNLILNTNSAYNGLLTKDPSSLYKWAQTDWDRLKGNVPWVGMNSDMLMILKMKSPDKQSKIETKYSKLETWVYEDEYAESVYFIKDDVILSMI